MSDTPAERQNLRAAVDDAIREAAEMAVLPRFKSLDAADIATKTGPQDFVTVADREAEHILSRRLQGLKPDAAIVGEEAAAEDPDMLNRLGQPGAVWVIDPIDGTGNFVAGLDAFAVVIALVEDGETRMGWIHHPLSGDTLWAAQGEGTWCGSARLSVQTPASPDLAAMKASLYHRAFRDVRGAFGQIERLGSAAMEYWLLADNRLDVTTFSRLKPWDHAAGVLIHQEAGGYSAMLDGSPYSPGNSEKRGLLSAPTREVWETVRAHADEHYV